MTHDKPNIIVQKRVHRGEDRLFIIMPYDIKRIERIKKIPGRKYSKTHRQWHLPDNPESQKRIREIFSTNQTKQIKKRPITINVFWMSKVQSFEKYLAQQRYASTTIGHYKQALLQFLIWWNNRDISELSLSEIKEYNHEHFIKEKRSRSAQNVWISALKLFLSKETTLDIDTYHVERPNKSNHLPDILSEEEAQRLIKGYDNLKHQTIIMCYYACGLRKSELINMKLSDIDSQRCIIRIRNSKGAKDRDVPLPDTLLEQLKKYYHKYKPKEYLFNGQNRLKYSASSIDKILKQGLKKAGINKNITTHNLRHSYATHLVEHNINLRYIQEALGHKSSKTTEIYTQLSKEHIANMISPIDFWNEI